MAYLRAYICRSVLTPLYFYRLVTFMHIGGQGGMGSICPWRGLFRASCNNSHRATAQGEVRKPERLSKPHMDSWCIVNGKGLCWVAQVNDTRVRCGMRVGVGKGAPTKDIMASVFAIAFACSLVATVHFSAPKPEKLSFLSYYMNLAMGSVGLFFGGWGLISVHASLPRMLELHL